MINYTQPKFECKSYMNIYLKSYWVIKMPFKQIKPVYVLFSYEKKRIGRKHKLRKFDFFVCVVFATNIVLDKRNDTSNSRIFFSVQLNFKLNNIVSSYKKALMLLSCLI